MTLHDAPSAFLPMHVLENVDAVVHGVREMRGRAARFSAADRPIIQHDDLLSSLREEIRRRQSCDAGADDADVRSGIAAKRRKRGSLEGAIPDGGGIAARKGVRFGHWMSS